jgi:curli biogenesis system outer membrane secretion channel CsgG
MTKRRQWVAAVGAVILTLLGCAYQRGTVETGTVLQEGRHAAILPLVNLTTYPHAGRIVGDLLTTEMYASSGFRIMESTEMLERVKGEEEDLERVLDRTVAQRIGSRLGVDTVVFGSVTEYRYKRGLDEDPVVGINIRVLDVKSGDVLAVGSRSETGGCFWFCEDSLNRLAQKVCHDLVRRMVKAN